MWRVLTSLLVLRNVSQWQGVFQGLLNKALTEWTQGGTTSKRENNQNAEKDPPGDMVTTRYWWEWNAIAMQTAWKLEPIHYYLEHPTPSVLSTCIFLLSCISAPIVPSIACAQSHTIQPYSWTHCVHCQYWTNICKFIKCRWHQFYTTELSLVQAADTTSMQPTARVRWKYLTMPSIKFLDYVF